MLPFNAGGWLIEVTIWADLTVFWFRKKRFQISKSRQNVLWSFYNSVGEKSNAA